jgi:hypothetical protein
LIGVEHVKFQGYFDVVAFQAYLKWIALRNLRILNLNIKRKLLSSLQLKSLHCFGELKQLNLESDTLEYRRGFMELIQVCTKLQQLHISGCKVLDDKAVMTIADSCKLLKVVSFPCWEGKNLEVTDTSIAYLTEQCTLLETFYVANFEKLTDASIAALSRHCLDLKELTLSNLPLITNASLLSVAEHSSQLTLLEVRRCPDVTDVGLSAVTSKCLDLRHLTVDTTQTKQQKWNPVQYRVFKDISLISKLLNLSSLRLVGVGVSAAMLDLITTTCKALRVFMLTGLALQATDYMCIPLNCPLLTELSLVGCFLSDLLVATIVESCVNLTLLDISGLPNTWGPGPTAASIIGIGKHGKRLQSLFASSMRSVRWNEKLIEDLLNGCPELRCLDLSHCTQFYSNIDCFYRGDLSKVIKSDTSLRELYVEGCRRSVGKEVIKKLKEIKGLEVFD